jgi:hypothetical protein
MTTDVYPRENCIAPAIGELSSLLTVKTLTGMTTDVYPRENCIAPVLGLEHSPGPA